MINPIFLPDKEYASATITSNISMAQGVANIPLNTITSNTPKLTLSNGGIRIGAGVSQIKANGGVFIDTSIGAGYNWFRIRKNTSDLKTCLVAGGTVYKSANITCNNPINVVEGDIIYLTNDVAGAGTPYTVRAPSANTWLEVEIIAS